MANCPICNTARLLGEDQQAMQACGRCARSLGLIPMPPQPRAQPPCARCSGTSFVRVIPRDRIDARADDDDPSLATPMYVTHVPKLSPRRTARGTQQLTFQAQGAGLLEAYICRGCGVVEWRCLNVDDIPIGPHHLAEHVEAGGHPYR